MRTQFCIWLVNLLLEREVTRLEINEAWRKSYYYDSRNTFLEYKKRAEDLFDIDIVCDRRTNKYYIKAPELLKADPLKRWLLSSMAAVACIDQCKTLSKRIMLEQTYGGELFLPVVTEAMSADLCINILYQPFWYEKPYLLTVEPYFVRLFRQRWYLIGFSHKHNMMRTFAFDRIQNVNISDSKFVMPEGVNVDNYFSDSYGIMLQDNLKKETIRLKFMAEQGIYIETCPLHSSQRLVSKTDEYMIFELNLKPTFDFFQVLLSYGSDVEVISPQSLREQIIKSIQCLSAMYL